MDERDECEGAGSEGNPGKRDGMIERTGNDKGAIEGVGRGAGVGPVEEEVPVIKEAGPGTAGEG